MLIGASQKVQPSRRKHWLVQQDTNQNTGADHRYTALTQKGVHASTPCFF
jgi:hypothetical protein